MSLELLDQGSLTRPGPIGRLLRLSLGVACLYGLWELIEAAPFVIERPVELLPNMALMIAVVLCVFNYVVNIGFSRDWGVFPVTVALSVLGAIAGVGYLLTGTASSTLLGIGLVVWIGYFFAHLGVSFVLAAMFATPGCEMRSIPELMGKISQRKVKEHACPSSFITGIDRWEQGVWKKSRDS